MSMGADWHGICPQTASKVGFLLPLSRSLSVLNVPLAVLNDKLSSSPYLHGAEFSVADLNVAVVMRRNQFARIDLSGRPNLVNWLRNCWSRPACPRKTVLLDGSERMH
jgi:glutathione S-transferase